MPLPDKLYLGTVSWSKPDWVGPFYPEKLKPSEFLEAYARSFRAVEIDSTFYRIPNRATVKGWRDGTSPGFIFTAKVPRLITHIKVLNDCQSELTAFLQNIEILGDRLGPLLLQFPYFNKNAFASREAFEALLRPFLRAVPKTFQIAIEIKNKNWITDDFLRLLGEHSVSLAHVVNAWMPKLARLTEELDSAKGKCCYVRFMGDRKGIESKTQKWDKIIEDKTGEMAVWADELKKIVAKGVPAYAFFSNYYAGFGPGSAKLFEKLWQEG
ncbi:MAG: DUF72 domain-containing protein [Candidatus Binatia bacterium]